MVNTSRYHFCSCSKVGFCMFRFARWPHGGPSLTLPESGLPPQFRRDKKQILSKKTRMFRPSLGVFGFFALAAITASAAGVPPVQVENSVLVSVKDQKLMLLQNGQRVAVYPISTSKYGLGDYWGHMTTPLGYLQVAQKIGDHAPV